MLSIKVRNQISLDSPPVEVFSMPGIELSVELPEAAFLEDPPTFHVVLTNTSERSIEIEIENPPSVDVVILTVDGKQVWRHQPPVGAGTGGSVDIPPGSSSRFPVTWNLTDDDGFTIPAGEYLARGFVRFSENGTGRYEPIYLRTATIPFTLTAAP
jgi:hypothetical protein